MFLDLYWRLGVALHGGTGGRSPALSHGDGLTAVAAFRCIVDRNTRDWVPAEEERFMWLLVPRATKPDGVKLAQAGHVMGQLTVAEGGGHMQRPGAAILLYNNLLP